MRTIFRLESTRLFYYYYIYFFYYTCHIFKWLKKINNIYDSGQVNIRNNSNIITQIFLQPFDIGNIIASIRHRMALPNFPSNRGQKKYFQKKKKWYCFASLWYCSSFNFKYFRFSFKIIHFCGKTWKYWKSNILPRITYPWGRTNKRYNNIWNGFKYFFSIILGWYYFIFVIL